MARLVDASRRSESREDLPRVLGPSQAVWAVRIVSRFRFVFLVGPSDAQGERITLFWWGFLFPVPFTVWLPVLPFGFGACACVGNTGKVNQRVGRSPVVWCMCVLKDSAREF